MPVTLDFPINVNDFVHNGMDLGTPFMTPAELVASNSSHPRGLVPVLRLPTKPAQPNTDVRYTLKAPRPLPYSEYKLFRAQLLENENVVGDVVCKAAEGPGILLRSLRTEANLYQGRLVPLQGDVVPKLVGYFEGYMPDEETKLGVLVLEYVGETWADGSSWTSRELSQRIIDAYVKIHKAGVQQGSPECLSYTIRPEDERLFIVGFSGGGEHDCRKPDMMILEMGMMMPNVPWLDCKELCELLAQLDAWIPWHVPYIGVSAPIETVLEGEEALVAIAVTNHADHAREGAKSTIKDLNEFIERTGYDIPAALAKDKAMQERMVAAGVVVQRFMPEDGSDSESSGEE